MNKLKKNFFLHSSVKKCTTDAELSGEGKATTVIRIEKKRKDWKKNILNFTMNGNCSLLQNKTKKICLIKKDNRHILETLIANMTNLIKSSFSIVKK